MKIQSLKIPTNPEYDFSLDPETQHGYVNPVTLNNKLIELSNAYVDVTKMVSEHLKRKAQLTNELEALRYALDDLEMQILDESPPTTSADTKNNKTIQAYIRRTLKAGGLWEEYTALAANQETLKEELLTIETSITIARGVLTAIQTQGVHIQTHLSFVKNEAKNSRHYV